MHCYINEHNKDKKDCTTSVLLHAAQIWTMKTQTEALEMWIEKNEKHQLAG